MYNIRHAVDADVQFIYTSWRETYAKSREAKWLNNKQWDKYEHLLGNVGTREESMYRRLQNLVIGKCVEHATILVACWDEDPNVVIGYACGAPRKVLHYVCVKPEWQNQGVARALLKALDIYGRMSIIYTHQTDAWREPATWMYNREMAIRPEKVNELPELFQT